MGRREFDKTSQFMYEVRRGICMSVRYVVFFLIALLLIGVSCRDEKPGNPAGASEGGKNGPALECGEASASGEYDRPKRTLTFGTERGDETGADERSDTGISEGGAAEAQSPTEGTGDQLS